MLIISFAAFCLGEWARGDVVSQQLRERELLSDSHSQRQREAAALAKELGLDKPLFYCALLTAACPDTFHRIALPQRQLAARELLHRSGNWPQVQAYLNSIYLLQYNVGTLPDSVKHGAWSAALYHLPNLSSEKDVQAAFLEMDGFLDSNGNMDYFDKAIVEQYSKVKNNYMAIGENALPYKLFFPKAVWYGRDNRYHRWLSGIFRGDFGKSDRDGLSVRFKLSQALPLTLGMNAAALMLAFLVSVPLAVGAAAKAGSLFDRAASGILFALYSVPNFWMATMLIILFTTSIYSPMLRIFPMGGTGSGGFADTLAHFTLPVFCVAYPLMAYIFRHLRSSMLEILGTDYIMAARAKGLGARRLLWRHAFTNAAFPLISLFGNVLPMVVSGSVAVEYLFDLHGMGLLMVESIFARDYNVVFAVVLVVALVTLLGSLLADILYHIVDKRIRY
jgi:peptide/nickel transport system permease protein